MENQPQKKNIKHHIKQNKHLFSWVALIIVAIIIAAGVIYVNVSANQIYIDKAEIAADKINLAPTSAGILEEVFVNEGDTIPANTIVARVNNQLIKSDVAGIVVAANKNFGTLFSPGQAIVTMIDPTDLRVVGRLAEDKGLKDVSIGQTAVFKIDAFGGKKYYGVVDEISPTSRDSAIAFNISDKRETKEFNIKVRFDTVTYAELKNGMSAKIWISKK